MIVNLTFFPFEDHRDLLLESIHPSVLNVLNFTLDRHGSLLPVNGAFDKR